MSQWAHNVSVVEQSASCIEVCLNREKRKIGNYLFDCVFSDTPPAALYYYLQLKRRQLKYQTHPELISEEYLTLKFHLVTVRSNWFYSVLLYF